MSVWWVWSNPARTPPFLFHTQPETPHYASGLTAAHGAEIPPLSLSIVSALHHGSCGLCDRLLNETGSVKKGQALCEGGKKKKADKLHSLHAFRSTGLSPGHFLSGAVFKRAGAAVPAQGSTVGQPAIELQPLFCGGVGQIRAHNCLPSQTGTAASLQPSFLWGAICEE